MLIERFIIVSSKLNVEVIPKQILQDSNDYIQDCNEVLGFIMDKYIITNNDKDRIQSSLLFADFKQKSGNNKMAPSKFKEDLLNIGGITFKRSGGSQFLGLKEKPSNYVVDE